jgi:membrane-associated phospholipid phosphatase
MATMKARGSEATPRGSGPASNDRALTHALAVRPLGGDATVGTAVEDRAPTSWASFVNSLASQDWLLLGYLGLILLALVFGTGNNRSACLVRVSADLGAYVFVLCLVRLQVLRWGGAAASLLYRVAILATLLGTFFQLREILPAVSPRAVDASIYAFDLRVFGVEPSVFFDRFVNRTTTEWFAFFYFLYFLVLTVHVLPVLFWLRDDRVLGQFGMGFLMVFLTAHLLYMVVPGWGPYWYLRGTFQHELQGATFWRLVREAVDAGGAQKDIFPSLHTAVPTFIAIFSFRHRQLVPFKYSWPVMAFVASQIIIATLFLRWHYLVDVVAGLVLATIAALLGPRIADWEAFRRDRMNIQPAWVPLAFPWSRQPDE